MRNVQTMQDSEKVNTKQVGKMKKNIVTARQMDNIREKFQLLNTYGRRLWKEYSMKLFFNGKN